MSATMSKENVKPNTAQPQMNTPFKGTAPEKRWPLHGVAMLSCVLSCYRAIVCNQSCVQSCYRVRYPSARAIMLPCGRTTVRSFYRECYRATVLPAILLFCYRAAAVPCYCTACMQLRRLSQRSTPQRASLHLTRPCLTSTSTTFTMWPP